MPTDHAQPKQQELKLFDFIDLNRSKSVLKAIDTNKTKFRWVSPCSTQPTISVLFNDRSKFSQYSHTVAN
jgi:hypothetical protein